MRYYLFLDECGDQNLSNFNPTFPVFTLCGVIIDEIEYNAMKIMVNNLKSKYWPNKKIILHSRDIRKCQNGFELLFDLNLKQQFYQDINQIISQSDYKIVTCSILKEPYIKKYGRMENVYGISLSFIMERTVFFLEELLKQKIISAVELITIAEKRGRDEDKELLSYYNMLLDKGTYYVEPNKMKRIFKEFHSQWKSDNEIGLQLADLLAYPIARHALNTNEVNYSYDILECKIYQKGENKYGFNIFPNE